METHALPAITAVRTTSQQLLTVHVNNQTLDSYHTTTDVNVRTIWIYTWISKRSLRMRIFYGANSKTKCILS